MNEQRQHEDRGAGRAARHQKPPFLAAQHPVDGDEPRRVIEKMGGRKCEEDKAGDQAQPRFVEPQCREKTRYRLPIIRHSQTPSEKQEVARIPGRIHIVQSGGLAVNIVHPAKKTVVPRQQPVKVLGGFG